MNWNDKNNPWGSGNGNNPWGGGSSGKDFEKTFNNYELLNYAKWKSIFKV